MFLFTDAHWFNISASLKKLFDSDHTYEDTDLWKISVVSYKTVKQLIKV